MTTHRSIASGSYTAKLRSRVRLAGCVAFVACTLPLQAAPAPTPEETLAAAKGTLKEWVEVLGIPNDSAVPADIQRNTAWFEQAFQRRGFRTRQLPADGKPMLFAEALNAKPSNTTILFYAHLDGQAVTHSEWQQESPWKPVLK
jgi:acetylornithine deacetylase/succinyl-diaminopimelate desuccinylase-like protein